MKKLLFTLALVAGISATSTAQKQVNWQLDKSHSLVSFSVSHMVISEVVGFFTDFDIQLTTNGLDATGGSTSGYVNVASITTMNPDRDTHLKSPDFFDNANIPKIEFKSKKIEKVDDMVYKIAGDFSMHGITKPVVFTATYNGSAKDPWGNFKTGWTATTTIDRYDWGLTWNKAIEAGNLLVGKEVTIKMNLEFSTKDISLD